MKSPLMKVMTGMLLTAFCLLGWCLGVAVSEAEHSAQAADPSRAVVLDTTSVTTEVCVVVVHRSRMVNRTPVARCATPEELKALVR